MKTNPAYLQLAYEKAIVGDIIQLLRDKYTGAFGGDPEKTIICEDVLRDDSEVPPWAIEDFIDNLTRKEAELNLELNRFEFVKREGEDEPSVTSKKKKASRKGTGQTRSRKGQARKQSPGNKA